MRRGFTLIEMLTVTLIIGALVALLLPAVQLAREGARKMQCRNNLGQMALAMQSYHASHRMLPSGTVNETGPVVSGTMTDNHFGWIVQILPQLDEGNLWRQFDFRRTSYQQQGDVPETDELDGDDAVDDYARLIVVTRDAPAFVTCTSLPTGRNDIMCYAGSYHDSGAPIDVDNNGVLFLNSSVRFRDITDGRSYTVMLGEILPSLMAAEWYQGNEETLRYLGGEGMDMWDNSPAKRAAMNLRGDPGMEIDAATKAAAMIPMRFGSIHADGSNIALADGAVRYLSSKTDGAILRRLGNRHDGEVLNGF